VPSTRDTETLEPRRYPLSSSAAPRGEEKTHHYLWRFWRVLPRAGHLGVFDRSYYGRLLVEGVGAFCWRPSGGGPTARSTSSRPSRPPSAWSSASSGCR